MGNDLARVEPAQVARTWEVDAPPEEVKALVRAAPRSLRRPAKLEHPLERASHDGRIFLDEQPDGVVLWRRPSHSWLYALRGLAERVPYPDMLRLSIEPTPHGSRVIATWEKHPLTKGSAVWIAALSVLVFASLLVVSWASPFWFVLAAAVTLAIPLARFGIHRRARGELLVAAHAALAAHEIGEADIEQSAYRRDR